MAVIPHSTPATPSLRVAVPLQAVVVRRVVPVVASVASVVVATLAAERAVASLALRAASSLGVQTVLAPPVRAEAGVLRGMVTETVVVERIITRRR